MSAAERASRNAELRGRLKAMKKDMGDQIGGIMSKMMGIFGMDPRDLLTDEEIKKLLTATFKKFDKHGSGKLELPEFHKSFEFLGLNASAEEIDRSFQAVDVDHSGLIDRAEFMTAIQN